MNRLLVLSILTAAALPAAEYKLKASPENIAYGYYWAGAKPVLTVKSGDIVEIETVSGNAERLIAAGVKPGDIQQELRDVQKIPREARGPGGHILTGPVAIEGAQPGDVLEVRIREIRMTVPYAYNNFRSTSGFLPGEFGEHMKIIPLDRERLIGHFGPGIELPLKP